MPVPKLRPKRHSVNPLGLWMTPKLLPSSWELNLWGNSPTVRSQVHSSLPSVPNSSILQVYLPASPNSHSLMVNLQSPPSFVIKYLVSEGLISFPSLNHFTLAFGWLTLALRTTFFLVCPCFFTSSFLSKPYSGSGAVKKINVSVLSKNKAKLCFFPFFLLQQHCRGKMKIYFGNIIVVDSAWTKFLNKNYRKPRGFLSKNPPAPVLWRHTIPGPTRPVPGSGPRGLGDPDPGFAITMLVPLIP